MPGPFRPAIYGTASNDFRKFDYDQIAPSTIDENHVLMLREDHSSYKWLSVYHDLTAETAA